MIGADGRMNSIARKFVVGENTPRYLNYVNWVGLLDDSSSISIDDTGIYDYWGNGERFAFVPLNHNRLYWAGCKVLPQNLGIPECGNKNKLQEIFQGWPKPICDIIEFTKDSAINRIEVYDHNPIDIWFNKRVTLLGDSAHAAAPTSGQGACQAIEDAYFIADSLTKADTIDEALLLYVNLRKDKTKNIILKARESANTIFETDHAISDERNLKRKEPSTNNFLMNAIKLWRVVET